MIMRLMGIGLQYLGAFARCQLGIFRRQQDLQDDAAQGHPRGEALVPHRLRQSDPLDARHPAGLPAGRQPKLSITRAAANRDGSITVYFGPTQPQGVPRGNWIQTMPGRGLEHDPAPVQPTEQFFTKKSQPNEIKLV